jgi:flagellar capping protein FliD
MSSSSIMSSVSSTSSSSSGAGLDVGATVDQLIYTEQAPERLLQQQQAALSAQASALRDINGRLETLESSINDLKDLSGAFGTRSVQSSNEMGTTPSQSPS